MSPANDKSNDNDALAVLLGFRDSWTEFWQWAFHESSQQIRDFGFSADQAGLSHMAELERLSTDFQDWEMTASQDAAFNPPNIGLTCEITTFSDDNSVETSETLTLAVESYVIDSLSVIEPVPRYESFTPTNTNIYVGDDPDDMPFLPFFDNETFDVVSHSYEYSRLSWQAPYTDPDWHIIIALAATRIAKESGLSFERIDATGVLPLSLLSSEASNTTGVAEICSQRSFPETYRQIQQEILDDIFQTDISPNDSNNEEVQLGERLLIDRDVTMFCPNLNCACLYCCTHSEKTLPLLPTAPRRRNEDFFRLVENPCEGDCFLLRDEGSSSTELVPWSDYDLKSLRDTLRLEPDISPCDLAVICRKSCAEVFLKRGALIPDISSTAIKPPRTRAGRHPAYEFDSSSFTPEGPCTHEGPCDGKSCRCFLIRARCERTCACDKNCRRRVAGCSCARTSKGTRICHTDRCPCYRAHRECDPEVCLRCEAKTGLPTGCQNVGLQHGWQKKVDVRTSAWGYGLYLLEPVRQGELIIEYTGELIFEMTSLCRDPLALHRKRNYLFGLNPTYSIDSTYSGNMSRFINHDAKEPNAAAEVRMVHGDHRVGIYALRSLAADTEIKFDYGDEFFTSDTT